MTARLVAAVLVGLAVLIGVAADQPAPAFGLGKIKCKDVVGYAQVDPIVAHDVPVSAHLHMFLGNAALLDLAHPESATYADLAGAATECLNPDDTAAYWFPTLLYTAGPNAGQPVPVRSFDAYYRSFDHKASGVAEPVPADARLVAGDAMAMTQQPLNVANWTCNEASSRRGPYHTIVEAACDKATGKVFLTLHVTFPSCWDGQLGDHDVAGVTADTAHFAYFDRRTDSCPAGFAHRVAELRETVWFRYTGDGSDVALSSDLAMARQGMPVAPGTTAHADFWNAWVQTGGVHGGMVGMVRDCINAPLKKQPGWCNP